MNRWMGELYQYGSTLNVDETKEAVYTERRVFGNAIISLRRDKFQTVSSLSFFALLGCVQVENKVSTTAACLSWTFLRPLNITPIASNKPSPALWCSFMVILRTCRFRHVRGGVLIGHLIQTIWYHHTQCQGWCTNLPPIQAICYYRTLMMSGCFDVMRWIRRKWKDCSHWESTQGP